MLSVGNHIDERGFQIFVEQVFWVDLTLAILNFFFHFLVEQRVVRRN